MKNTAANKKSNGKHASAYTMTFFPNKYAKRMKVETVSLQELADRVVSTTKREKDDLPFVKLATFNGEINPDNPEDGCLRYDKGVVEINGVEGDKDNEPLEFDEAAKKLEAANVQALLYTSASPGHFRVIAPTSRPLQPGSRKGLMARLNGVLDGALSPESFTLSQSYYFGHVKGKPAPRIHITKGRYIDQCNDLDAGAIGKKKKQSDDDSYSNLEAWGEQFKEPIDIDEVYANMAWKETSPDGKGNLYLSLLSLTAAGLNRYPQRPIDDAAIEAVIDEIQKRVIETIDTRGLDWKETRAKMEKMCRGWLRKHPELVAAAPGEEEVPKINVEAYGFPAEQSLERYDWLSGRHLLRGEVCGTAASGGTGKSSMGIVDALAMTSGHHLLHDTVPTTPLRVVLINLEDKRNTMDKRIAAAMRHHGLKPEDIGDRLIVIAKGKLKFKIAKQSKSGEVQRNEAAITALANLVIEKKADVLSIDSFIRTHQVSENDNPAIEQVIECFEEIALRANCCVHLWHHTRKGKGDGQGATVESSRGAGAFIDACRSVRILETMSAEQADKLGIVEKHRQYFRAFSGKRNFAPHVEESNWFHIASVTLDNGPKYFSAEGDNIGVVETWSMPEAKATPENIEAIKQALANGEWRENVQASMWAGKAIAPIVGRDPDNDRELIRKLIRKLIREGVLKTISGYSAERKACLFVVPSDWAAPIIPLDHKSQAATEPAAVAEQKCESCGRKFKNKRFGMRFCSDKCRVKAHRK